MERLYGHRGALKQVASLGCIWLSHRHAGEMVGRAGRKGPLGKGGGARPAATSCSLYVPMHARAFILKKCLQSCDVILVGIWAVRDARLTQGQQTVVLASAQMKKRA